MLPARFAARLVFALRCRFECPSGGPRTGVKRSQGYRGEGGVASFAPLVMACPVFEMSLPAPAVV